MMCKAKVRDLYNASEHQVDILGRGYSVLIDSQSHVVLSSPIFIVSKKCVGACRILDDCSHASTTRHLLAVITSQSCCVLLSSAGHGS
ncbi:hypothetical protein CY34DRAFT_600444 [Suillus luteus UH-Slu-Lm8-n1]|uniref:Uncharacterized protein n=1 Tax=Suillus luteus UH-Slu-Lm8-n1 TaxID=930992 RepID=A0A0D0AAI1_9AGAM|nr:hypothetical protein CY34DRAFT_600444 [Suillus luteus UH-Slu-Lm8-n1]